MVIIILYIVLYNDDIKKINLSQLSIEKHVKKVENIASHINGGLVSFYQSQMISICHTDTLNTLGSGFDGFNILWEHYSSLSAVLKGYDKLPKELQAQIIKEYKYAVKFALAAQQNKISHDKKVLPYNELKLFEIPNDENNDYKNALSAHKSLYKRYKKLYPDTELADLPKTMGLYNPSDT